MIAYVGQTRSRELVRELDRLGIGECTVTGEMNPRRDRWFHDNGAFRDFVAGRGFNVTRWCRDMMRIRNSGGKLRPDFVVVPDIVAGGVDSLDFSAMWRDDVDGVGPAYLAVQDGMTEGLVDAHAARYAGIFVGGTLEWKLATAPAWVRFAHARGMRCHVGRVGPAARVRWARAIGADSIDSSLPLMSAGHMDAFVGALREAA